MTFRILIAGHNRRAASLRCLHALSAAAEMAGASLEIYFFDDGSSDGTRAALQEHYPAVKVLCGDGTNYWAASMAQAELRASEESEPRDVFVWLNDDVILDADAVSRMEAALGSHPSRVLVGTTRDPVSHEATYGGLMRSGLHPLRFRLVKPEEQSFIPVDAFNGNLVAIPYAVLEELGGIDGGFPHAWADIDFGLRLGRARRPALLMPGTYGTCSRNPAPPRLPALADWQRFRGTKGGGNFSAMRRLLSRQVGRSWPIPIIWTYAAWWVRRGLGSD